VPNGRARTATAVTLRDVARLAGVHPGTVSRALNAETRALVNSETAERVLQAAQSLGYRPNPIARGLKTNRSYTVGVLIPDITNPLFPPIVRGIEDRLDESGYIPLVANTDNDPEREEVDLVAMRARQVDAIITATARRDHGVLTDIVAAGVPVVLVNRGVEDGSLPAVTPADRLGMRQAVDHVVELGHRHIAHLAGPQELSTGFQRHHGFLDAMSRAGVPVAEGLVRFGHRFTAQEGYRLCRELLAEGREVTAVVAGNDLLALGCYDALVEAGLRCPQDVSVVGFNDMRFADRFNPPLTTVRVPHYDIGTTAAELLLEQLADDAPPPRQIELPTELVTRRSTAPPPA
jgi:LacI family transcriptional regulator